ncbi:MAG: type II CAAX endopeptidase family protein [Bryobacteraceae bacterium]|jgi:membrane protease YdiL (CAAX protease family)
MSPEEPPPSPDLPELEPQALAAPEPPPEPPPKESYPFWGYLDLLGFVLIALFGSVLEALLMNVLISVTHVKQIYVLMPAQVLLYAFLMGSLAVIFRRYYGRPFWQSLRWWPAGRSAGFVAACGVAAAFTVMVASVAIGTPDIDSPMKALLSDPTSVLFIAVIGTTLAPICEEIVFRGFLQPLLVRSLGSAPGILLAAAAFGLMHFQEYGNSWRHALLISGAGAAFGWMRQRTGSTKAAAMMHAAYNCVFFVLLAVQQVASHARWAGH